MNYATAQHVVAKLNALSDRFGPLKPTAVFDGPYVQYVVFVPTASGAPGAQLQTLADAERLMHGLEAQR